MRLVSVVIALSACGASVRPGTSDGPHGGGSDSSGGGGDGNTGQASVYAHTASSLYRVDPDTFAITKVGDFGFSVLEEMTDLGIDANGALVGVSRTSVYAVDASTAHATLLSTGTIGGQFNGLSFVPSAGGPDILIGTTNSDGNVYQINPMTGAATAIGNMGGSYVSSGDVVSVAGFGTVQTVPGSTHDVLVKLAPGTYAATPIGSNTGFDEIFGLGFWKGKVFGFTSAGQIITIDPMTGVGTQVATTSMSWYGAAVTTTAPIIP
jgi:hypothetical protein